MTGSDPFPIPQLPGLRANIPLERARPKSSTLKYKNGFPIVEDLATVEAGATFFPNYTQPQQPATAAWGSTPAHGTTSKTRNSTTLANSTSKPPKLPNWLLYDRQVLRFSAYFTEKVDFSPVEKLRVRKCQLHYYLEDDTLEVLEPKEGNSGLVQGKLLGRRKITSPDGQVFTWHKLRVGAPVTLYGRSYSLVSCDAFTRAFYEQQDEPQPADQLMPEGDVETAKKVQQASQHQRPPRMKDDNEPLSIEPRGPNAVFRYLPPRLQHELTDGQVLRFYCCWDDTQREMGVKLPLVLLYYLADDTLEVAEQHRRNAGRDPFPRMLSRCKLPKTVPPVGGRPLSPASLRQLHLEYYHWRDLRIGSVVKVYGRDLLVYDCDGFTKQWLEKHLSLRPEQLAPVQVDFEMTAKRPPLTIPPDTLGIGNEEDTARNVVHLIPKPPLGDYLQFMQNWNKVMRFSVRMVDLPSHPLAGVHDKDRRFVLSYHLLDRTMSIFEPPRDNSGFPGGKFMERTQVKKRDGTGVSTDADLYVGAVLLVHGRAFELVDADEHTYRFMEQECAQYPMADFDKVLAKLQGLLQDGEAAGGLNAKLDGLQEAGSASISCQQLHAMLQGSGVSVSLHEVITLGRRLAGPGRDLPLQSLRQLLGLPEPTAQPNSTSVHDDAVEAHGPVAAREEGAPKPRIAWQEPVAQHRATQHMDNEATAKPSTHVKDPRFMPIPGAPGYPLTSSPPKQHPNSKPAVPPVSPGIQYAKPQQINPEALKQLLNQTRAQPHMQNYLTQNRPPSSSSDTSSSQTVRGLGASLATQFQQPKSLWLTSNQALGGIHNQLSLGDTGRIPNKPTTRRQAFM